MKRDWDLVRAILQRLEMADPPMPMMADNFDGYMKQNVAYHMELMREAGLIEASILKEMSGLNTEAVALRMTWQGHEFLDAIRNDTVWNKVKQTALEKGIDLTFNLAAQLAGQFLKNAVGIL